MLIPVPEAAREIIIVAVLPVSLNFLRRLFTRSVRTRHNHCRTFST